MRDNEAAILSQDVYENPDRKEENYNYKDAKKHGWEYVASSDDLGLSKDGYFGAIFKKGDEVAVVHRGTNLPEFSLSSDLDDNYSIYNNKVPDQYKYALGLTQYAQEKYGNGNNLVTVGHSAGMSYAQLTGIAIGIPSIGFDGPGIAGVANQLFTPGQILDHRSTVYASTPNAINTCGEQLVTPTQLDFDYPIQTLSYAEYLSRHTIGRHKIKNFVKSFNPETGLPYNYKQPESWPVGYKAGFETFAKDALQKKGTSTILVPKNGLSKEEFSKKYGVDPSRVKSYKLPPVSDPEFGGELHVRMVTNYYVEPAKPTKTSSMERMSYLGSPDYTLGMNKGSDNTLNVGNFAYPKYGYYGIYGSVEGRGPFIHNLQGSQGLNPLYNYKPLYKEGNIFSDLFNKQDSLLNEPSWLLYKSGIITNKGTINGAPPLGSKESLDFHNALDKVKQAVKNCLLTGCFSSLDSLISRVDVRGLASSLSAYKDNIISEFSQSGVHRYGLGKWITPLTKEVGYATSHVSPLILDLNGDGIKLFSYKDGVYFDIDNDNFAERVGWVSPEDGQLAIDINGNGVIDDITELFGDDLVSAFFKLSLLDSNGDKVIDGKDEDFNDLLIWQDLNSNGYSEPNELKTLKEAKIKSISLNTRTDDREIEGNLITEVSEFTFEDGRKGEVADVHYTNDDIDSWYKGKEKGYKFDKQELKEIKSEFRKQLFKDFLDKLSNLRSINPREDWLALVIKENLNKFIEKLKQQSDLEANEILSKYNKSFNVKTKEHKSRCVDEKMELITQTSAKLSNLKVKVKDELSDEINARYKQEVDSIKSKYIQQLNKGKEFLLDSINAKLRAEYKSENDRLFEHYTAIGGSQSEYDNAVKEAFEAIKGKYDREYKAQFEALSEEIAKKIKQEKAEAARKYTKELDEGIQKTTSELDKSLKLEFEEESHKSTQNCENEGQKLGRLFADNVLKKKASNETWLKAIESIIKQEANKYYKFLSMEISLSQLLGTVEGGENFAFSSLENLGASFHIYNAVIEPTEEEQSNKDVSNNGSYQVKIDPDTLFMPMMRGTGELPSLHIAMSEDQKLKEMVGKFVTQPLAEFHTIQNKTAEILYQWAGVSHIDNNLKATAYGVNIEARKVAAIEQITGQEFKQLGAAQFVGQHASAAIQKAWDIALMRTMNNLVVQGPLTPIFPHAKYSFAEDAIKLNSSLKYIVKAAKDYASSMGREFWIRIGYILINHKKDLDSTTSEINKVISDAAGVKINISEDGFYIIGDDEDNTLVGTSSSDYIKGLKGNDRIYGGAESDEIEGNEGDDELYGEEGIDRIYGGPGNDKIYGGKDRDFMYGGPGSDEMYGEEGDDHIEGGEGPDYMDGGEGTDTLSYGESKQGVKVNLKTGEASGGDAQGDTFKNFENIGGSEQDDILIGDDQDNHINGEGGNDKIYGGKGNDTLFGAKGEDYLYGEEGDDTLTGFEGPDHMDGGEGSDTVSYHHPYSIHGVKVDLKQGIGIGGFAHGDTYVSIENVRGSKFNDKIVGDDNSNILYGMGGNDFIQGLGGNDTIVAGSGNNKLFGGDGDDMFILGFGSNYINGGEGTDTVSYQSSTKALKINLLKGTAAVSITYMDKLSGIENVIGTKHNDEIIGNHLPNKLIGLEGNDVIYGMGGNDFIILGQGNNTVFAGGGDDHILSNAGQNTIDGGDGKDVVDYSKEENEGIEIDLQKGVVRGGIAKGDKFKSIEGIVGTKFNDTLRGDSKDNVLNGLGGNDIIYGGDGNDILIGGEGKNKLFGEGGNDRFIIGKGENDVKGGDGYFDMVLFTNALGSVEVNLVEQKSKKSSGEEDTFEGIDGVIGSDFDDVIVGNENGNHLDGRGGDDYIIGGDWSDTIIGGEGKNTLIGGKGNDKFIVVEGENNVDGGEGEDTISYITLRENEYKERVIEEIRIREKNEALPSFFNQPLNALKTLSEQGVEVSLATHTVRKPNGKIDKFTSIEKVEGTHYNDVIIGDSGNNTLIGVDGDDIIKGLEGDDKLISGRGFSRLEGGEGNDEFIVKDGGADVYGGQGYDTLNLALYPTSVKINLAKGIAKYQNETKGEINSVEVIVGTIFDDLIIDSPGDDTIDAGVGDNTIVLTDGEDALNVASGNNFIYLAGKGKKAIWFGYGQNNLILTNQYSVDNPTDTVILGFKPNLKNKIDLSSFQGISDIEEITVSQIEKEDLSFAIIKPANGKEVALLDVNVEDLGPENFIFFNSSSESFSQSYTAGLNAAYELF